MGRQKIGIQTNFVKWHCPLCGETDMDPVVRTYDYNHRFPGVFTYGRCSSCGLARQNPRPHPDNLASYYPENYGASRVSLQDVETRINSYANRKRYQELLWCHPTQGYILDIGCGRGYFLALMERNGWRVAGCDSAQEHIEFAEKLLNTRELATCIWPDDALPFDNIDVLSMFHLLEHLNDPVEAMSKANELLNTGGICMIETPNFNSLVSALYGSRANLYDAPRHLCLFNAYTLSRLLNKTGFEVLKIITYTPTLLNYRESLRYTINDIGLRKYDAPNADTSLSVTSPSKTVTSVSALKLNMIRALHLCENGFFRTIDAVAAMFGRGSDLLCIAMKR